MGNKVQCGWSERDGFAQSGGKTAYLPLGDGSSSGFGNSEYTTESNAQLTCPFDGVVSLLMVWIKANTASGTTTFTGMKDGSAQSVTVSFATSVTGEVQDTTNSFTVTDGDAVYLRMVTAAGTGDVEVASMAWINAPDSGSPKVFVGPQANSDTTDSQQSYFGFFGRPDDFNTNSQQAAMECDDGWIASDLQVNETTNSRSTSSTMTSHINGSSGNQTVTITASGTGWYHDASNTDTLSAGDDLEVGYLTSTGGGTTRPFNISMTIASDGLGTPWIAHRIGSYSSTSTEYSAVFGGLDDIDEDSSRCVAAHGGTWEKLGVRVLTNGAGAKTSKSYINQVVGNQSVSITASTTGYFEDASNSDTIAAGDDLNAQHNFTGSSVSLGVVQSFMTDTDASAGGGGVPGGSLALMGVGI